MEDDIVVIHMGAGACRDVVLSFASEIGPVERWFCQ
jgi:hypothetical protein